MKTNTLTMDTWHKPWHEDISRRLSLVKETPKYEKKKRLWNDNEKASRRSANRQWHSRRVTHKQVLSTSKLLRVRTKNQAYEKTRRGWYRRSSCLLQRTILAGAKRTERHRQARCWGELRVLHRRWSARTQEKWKGCETPTKIWRRWRGQQIPLNVKVIHTYKQIHTYSDKHTWSQQSLI